MRLRPDAEVDAAWGVVPAAPVRIGGGHVADGELRDQHTKVARGETPHAESEAARATALAISADDKIERPIRAVGKGNSHAGRLLVECSNVIVIDVLDRVARPLPEQLRDIAAQDLDLADEVRGFGYGEAGPGGVVGVDAADAFVADGARAHGVADAEDVDDLVGDARDVDLLAGEAAGRGALDDCSGEVVAGEEEREGGARDACAAYEDSLGAHVKRLM